MIKKARIDQIKTNDSNPRIIKDDKFTKLVNSIKNFPEMLKIRPIVVDENMVVLGGNMRLRACIEAGLTEVPIDQVTDWTEEQKKEFIIKDNVGFGEWDWDILANDWEVQNLNDWGLEVWNQQDYDVEDFFTEEQEKVPSYKIVLEYSENDFNEVIDAFDEREGSKEDIVLKLLLDR